MRVVAVDTSVLLAICKGEQAGTAWFRTLRSLAEVTVLVFSPIVLSEVCSWFPSEHACIAALEELELQYSTLSDKAALLAGTIFRRYRAEGGPRTTILPDFLVAAHAAVQADALATLDRGYLRRYFPRVHLISAPDLA